MTQMHDMTILAAACEEAGKNLLEAARSGDGIAMRRVLKDHHDLIVSQAPKHLSNDELTTHIHTYMHPVIRVADAKGDTALHLAASHAKPEQRNALVRIMVEAGADMGARNASGKTALEMVPQARSFAQRLIGAREQVPATSASMGV